MQENNIACSITRNRVAQFMQKDAVSEPSYVSKKSYVNKIGGDISLEKKDNKRLEKYNIEEYMQEIPIDYINEIKKSFHDGEIDIENLMKELVNDVAINTQKPIEADFMLVIENNFNTLEGVNLKDKNNCTLLMWAAKHNYNIILNFLIQNNANYRAKDVYGNTVLHYAIENAYNISILKTLSPYFKKIDVLNSNKESAIHLAVKNITKSGTTKIVAYLVSKGVKLKDINGKNAATYLLEAKLHIENHSSCLCEILNKIQESTSTYSLLENITTKEKDILSSIIGKEDLATMVKEDINFLLEAIEHTFIEHEKFDPTVQEIIDTSKKKHNFLLEIASYSKLI